MPKFQDMAKYRIVQVSTCGFVVEKAWQNVVVTGWLWWKKYETVERWLPIGKAPYMRGFPSPPAKHPFRSQAAAQQWIDDKRKYPIVIKENA